MPSSSQHEKFGRQGGRHEKSGSKVKVKNLRTSREEREEEDERVDTPELTTILADLFVLYMKSYAVHWNYQGPKFFSVHKLTETHYQEMALAIDEFAERIRAKKDEAPFSLAGILEAANLEELPEDGGSSDRSVRDLANSHLEFSRKAKELVEEIEDEDPYTADMLTAQIGAHDKAAWMLKSLLAD